MNYYDNNQTAKNYLNFLNSEDGTIQQEILGSAILKQLDENPSLSILDAACGSGWLTNLLSKTFNDTQGCDSSKDLISHAQKQYPSLNFKIADLGNPLPYPQESQDVIILNMAATDLSDLHTSYRNLKAVLKTNGKLIVTIPNPATSFPVGIWKRNIFDLFFGNKPKLYIRPLPKNSKSLVTSWDHKTSTSFYYSLSEHINAVTKNGFALTELCELQSKVDSQKYNMRYRLYRFPLLLLLEFKKL